MRLLQETTRARSAQQSFYGSEELLVWSSQEGTQRDGSWSQVVGEAAWVTGTAAGCGGDREQWLGGWTTAMADGGADGGGRCGAGGDMRHGCNKEGALRLQETPGLRGPRGGSEGQSVGMGALAGLPNSDGQQRRPTA